MGQTGVDDRWELHRGDCLAVLAKLPDASVDAIITDPPYSSGGFTRGDRMQTTEAKYIRSGAEPVAPRASFTGDNRDGRAWHYWMALWISECHRVLRDAGYFLMFTDWRMLPTATDAVQAGGMVWRGLVAWDKGRGARAPHTGYFRHQCEYIVWGTRGGLPQGGGYGGPWDGCIHETVRQDDKHHQTGKPTRLLEELVQIVPKDATVLDPFAGSGTTGVACARRGRRFLGVELSPEYYPIAERRVREAYAESVGDLDQLELPLFGGTEDGSAGDTGGGETPF